MVVFDPYCDVNVYFGKQSGCSLTIYRWAVHCISNCFIGNDWIVLCIDITDHEKLNLNLFSDPHRALI